MKMSFSLHAKQRIRQRAHVSYINNLRYERLTETTWWICGDNVNLLGTGKVDDKGIFIVTVLNVEERRWKSCTNKWVA